MSKVWLAFWVAHLHDCIVRCIRGRNRNRNVCHAVPVFPPVQYIVGTVGRQGDVLGSFLFEMDYESLLHD